jgi:hypothetical protein
MGRGHEPQTERASGSEATRRTRLICAATSSLALSTVIVVTASSANARLGAPTYWPWLLTGLQVFALWSAGTRRWWGWLLGAAVQPPWIAYAVVTTQLGFIPGCAVSAVVQIHSFLSGRSRSASRRDAATRNVEGYA